jgi:hypothetical protein
MNKRKFQYLYNNNIDIYIFIYLFNLKISDLTSTESNPCCCNKRIYLARVALVTATSCLNDLIKYVVVTCTVSNIYNRIKY